MLDFTSKSNGSVTFKQFTNDRFYAEAFVPDPNSTEEVDAFTVAQLRPGLRSEELLFMIIRLPAEGGETFSDNVPRYFFKMMDTLRPVVYDGAVVDGMYYIYHQDDLDIKTARYVTDIYDTVTGRIFKPRYQKADADFQLYLAYRKKYETGSLMPDFISKSNGSVAFKQFTNDRFYAEAFVPDPNSANAIDAITLSKLRPGLEPEELLFAIIPGLSYYGGDFSDGVTRYSYKMVESVHPVTYDGVCIDGMYQIQGDGGDIKGSTYACDIYDAVTGRLVRLRSDSADVTEEDFNMLLEYREQVRKGEIVDEH